MSPQKTVRYQARQALRGNYAKAVCGLVIGLLPIYAIDGALTAIACSLAMVIGSEGIGEIIINCAIYPIMIVAGALVSPIFNGYVRMYYRNSYIGGMDMNDLFFYFSRERYIRTVRLNLSFILRMLIPAALFFSPVIIYTIICANMDNGFAGSVLYGDFYFILFVLSLVLTTLYSLRYFAVFTLYVENEQHGAKEIFVLSRRIMKNHGSNAASLVFSYTPWMLLCLLVLPGLYVIPYMTQGLCIGSKWMIQAAYEGQATT